MCSEGDQPGPPGRDGVPEEELGSRKCMGKGQEQQQPAGVGRELGVLY